MLELIEELRIEIMVIFFSMLPIVEVRGAIPLGISLGLSPVHSAILGIIGNIIIVPFLLKLLYPIMSFFEKTVIFSKTIGWIKRRSMKKSRTIKKYSLIGLFIFVAVPIPTTGAWTGSVIASMLKLDFKKSLMAISLGVVSSGLIVLTISYGIVSIF
ncbi:small multi-drug export protein [Tissierella pigra]|uniref:Small multi-drug export protein n=1 Tax=Tissierella pigra TaxID=2607614 RepID=A0A6N7XEG6_9FIRM|nr:small multi-drug export protein [Tissierella pigra]MBU5427820.1 small multi-drug export protein [Tissierella pigra]MSU00146.1 small multi-drug export protein [Tissierella pigra]